MSFTVVYDACVLYPVSLRDLLIRLATKGLFWAKWTDEILDETFRAILRTRPDLDGKLERTRELMNLSIPDVRVTGHLRLVPSLHLPDSDDRHVLAAAIQAGAQVIVTENLRDFPADVLAPFGIEAIHPDDFVLDVIDLSSTKVHEAIYEMASIKRKPTMSTEDVLDSLHRAGLTRSAAKLRL